MSQDNTNLEQSCFCVLIKSKFQDNYFPRFLECCSCVPRQYLFTII